MNTELKKSLNEFKSSQSMINNNNKENNLETFIKNFNNNILEKSLMPELIENEKQKRKFKKIVLTRVCLFIILYSVLMLISLLLLVWAVTFGSNRYSNIDVNLCSKHIEFMKFFVTASLCEFIAMLYVIVKYVFDKSIVKLVKLFKEDNISKKNSISQSKTEEIAECNIEESA